MTAQSERLSVLVCVSHFNPAGITLTAFLPDLNERPGIIVSPDEKFKSDSFCIPSCSLLSFDRFDFDLILLVC